MQKNSLVGCYALHTSEKTGSIELLRGCECCMIERWIALCARGPSLDSSRNPLQQIIMTRVRVVFLVAELCRIAYDCVHMEEFHWRPNEHERFLLDTPLT